MRGGAPVKRPRAAWLSAVKKYSSTATTTASAVTQTAGESRLPALEARSMRPAGSAAASRPSARARGCYGDRDGRRLGCARHLPTAPAAPQRRCRRPRRISRRNYPAIWRAVASMRREPICASLPPTFASTT